MKNLQKIGVFLLCFGVIVFSLSPFFSAYRPDARRITEALANTSAQAIEPVLQTQFQGRDQIGIVAWSAAIQEAVESHNTVQKAEGKWDEVIWDNPRDLAVTLGASMISGPVAEQRMLFLFLTFGLAILGGLMYIIPQVKLLGPPGIKNNGVFHHAATNRGWIAWLVFPWLVGFYILLYFFPDLTQTWSLIVDPVSQLISGKPASRWFMYGLMYCTVMLVMGVRMYIKYRDNRYQIVRTTSVLFFQIAFAFMIPEIMGRFNMPQQDFKNIWPLDYSFFFSWRLDQMLDQGTLGIFMLVWGLLLIIVAVPVFVYFFGKRWYCSWVCGCGGLAETLGDPYRHLSDKSVKAWKFERYIIHGVLGFAALMTAITLYTYFSGVSQVGPVDTFAVQKTYGFLIGSVFAGVIGTGFYPVMGNRVWCRFGCPLAAYLGFVQRFKSRFRITTNGGQCISCGNCSTYCEMGIDVRWYAQRGQNIVRSSCVGCGICSAVCPRGVLKLENGPETGRINDNPILIGKEGVQLSVEILSNKSTK